MKCIPGCGAAGIWLTLAALAAAQPRGELAPSQRIGGFSDWTTSVAFSPDGRLLAIGSYDLVKLWNVPEQTEAGVLKTGCGFAQAVAFTRDGGQLIVGGYQQVQVWDVAAMQKSATLRGHKGYVRDLALDPRGERLATACEDQVVRLWQLKDHQQIQAIGPLEYPVLGIAWSPDGAQLATACGDETRLTKPGLVQLWDAAGGELVRAFPPHEKAATDVAFSRDGKQLLSTALDERVHVDDVATGEAIGFFGGHSRPVNCVVIAPDSGVAVTGSGGRFQGKNEIKLFLPADGEELATLDLHEGKVTALALAPDGHTLSSASHDKSVAVWDLTPVLPATAPRPTEAPVVAAVALDDQPSPTEPDIMRIGIIGLDTSHAPAFTKLFNAAETVPALKGLRIVAAYPQGSPDIESSVSRVPGYTAEVQELGVEIVGSIDELVSRVDAVLLESNDGRPHLEQVLPVLKARKPVFIDKPIAASLEDAIAILEAARHYGTPCFSASSLRWIGEMANIRAGNYGPVLGCDTFSPCALEPTHPDLYWYGIHGVEVLVAAMGTGLQSVSRASTEPFDVVTGIWEGGRIGTFRGARAGARGYGGTAFCDKKTVPLGPYPGYQPLVEQIAQFFRSGQPPVDAAETIEICTFMSAADESRRQGGKPVDVAPLRAQATAAAHAKLAKLIEGYQPAAP